LISFCDRMPRSSKAAKIAILRLFLSLGAVARREQVKPKQQKEHSTIWKENKVW
jgi:hypothetical protein